MARIVPRDTGSESSENGVMEVSIQGSRRWKPLFQDPTFGETEFHRQRSSTVALMAGDRSDSLNAFARLSCSMPVGRISQTQTDGEASQSLCTGSVRLKKSLMCMIDEPIPGDKASSSGSSESVAQLEVKAALTELEESVERPASPDPHHPACKAVSLETLEVPASSSTRRHLVPSLSGISALTDVSKATNELIKEIGGEVRPMRGSDNEPRSSGHQSQTHLAVMPMDPTASQDSSLVAYALAVCEPNTPMRSPVRPATPESALTDVTGATAELIRDATSE